MISREIIQELLIAGCAAPSGGNSQPWEFEVSGNTIKVILKPEKDHPVLNVENRGTWIAHGALIENIAIAASVHSISVSIKTYSEEGDIFIGSLLELREDQSIKVDDLSAVLFDRATNRKHFTLNPIPEDTLSNIESATTKSPVLSVDVVTDRDAIARIAKAFSTGDRIMFENKILHDLFFKEVVWDKEQEAKKGGGLLIDTLELAKPQRTMMHLLKYWPAMSIAAKIGIAKQIAKENEQTHSSCGALCIVRVGDTKDSFVEAGRQIERMWLAATKAGLSFHFNSGLFFFWQGIQAGTTAQVFSADEQKDILAAYNVIDAETKNKTGMITAMLRMGYGEQPTTKSLKPAPIVNWSN